MTLDDDLRHRLQQAADRAGEGTNPGALAAAVAASGGGDGRGGAGSGRSSSHHTARLWGGLAAIGLVGGAILGVTMLRPRIQDDTVPAATTAAGGTSSVAGITTVPDTVRVTVPDLTSGTATAAATTVGPATVLPTVPVTPPASPPLSTPPPTPPTSPATTQPATTQPADTQQPTLQASAGAVEIYDAAWPECQNETVVTALATDNVAVISVTATWAGLPGSPLAFTHGSGAVWTATFGPFSGLGASYSQDVTLTVTARDAAGNARSAAVVVHVWGTCLI